MTKDEVKTLCEDDPQLQWWAMVLFAEIGELTNLKEQGHTSDALLSMICRKVAEFDGFIKRRALEKAGGKSGAKPSADAEWQLVGTDNWVFGVKVRGFVRVILAETYFSKYADDYRGGWVCMARPESCYAVNEHGNRELVSQPTRSLQCSSRAAIRWCEEQLGYEHD